MTVESVRLGLSPPLSGLVGMYGQEISWAGRIACQEINESGGVLGRALELVIEDDGSLPESAVDAANKLIKQHGCVAIIGNLLSNSRIAVAYRVAEPLKIPYLNFSFYEGSIQSRYFFHFAALPNQQIDQMIPYMRRQYGPRMFFAGNNYEWPRGSIDAAKRALLEVGGEIVGEEYYPIGVSRWEIGQLLKKVTRANPDVFVPYFAGADQISLLTQFTQEGLKEHMAVVMGHYDEMMASRLPPAVREGFYSSNTYFMPVDTPQNRNYMKRLARQPDVNGIWPQGNGILTNFGEGTYLCVKAFAKAANTAGSLDPEVLVETLEQVVLKGPQGEVQMDPGTHHAQVNTYLARCRADGVFSIIEAFGVMAPIIPERYDHQRIKHQATLEEDIRLQARMLEQMTEGVFLFENSGNTVIYNNAGGERLFGYAKGELEGMRLSALIAPDASPVQTADRISSVLLQSGRWQGEMQACKKQGETFWCAAQASAFTHPVYGEVWMMVLQDITLLKEMQQDIERHRNQLQASYEKLSKETAERKEMESKLRQAHKMEAIGTLAGGVAHDFNNILSAILGYAELAAREVPTSNPASPHIEQVLRAGNRAKDLVQHILAFSRKSAFKRLPVKIDVLVWEALELLRASIPATIKIQSRIDDLSASVLADPTGVHQILINLCTNAAQAMETLGGVLEVSLSRVIVDEHSMLADAEAGTYVKLCVKDTGAGIDQDVIDRIFDPYFTTKETGKGSGMGLTVVHGIVKSLDGVITVASSSGSGSEFNVYLPIVDEPVFAARESKRDLPTGDERILVVDDEESLVELARIRLVHLGYDVTTRTSSREALALFRDQPQAYDIVISDQTMPDMTGEVLARELKAIREDVPVIICSGYSARLHADEAKRLSIDAFITKPVDFSVLAETLREVLDR